LSKVGCIELRCNKEGEEKEDLARARRKEEATANFEHVY
jgi:hypothetical protein